MLSDIANRMQHSPSRRKQVVKVKGGAIETLFGKTSSSQETSPEVSSAMDIHAQGQQLLTNKDQEVRDKRKDYEFVERRKRSSEEKQRVLEVKKVKFEEVGKDLDAGCCKKNCLR